MQYRTIRAAASAEFVEKRSRFIGYISPVTTQQGRDSVHRFDKVEALGRDAQCPGIYNQKWQHLPLFG